MQNEDSKSWRVAPRYRIRGLGSRSNNMGADVGGRSSQAKEHSRSKASWIREKISDLPRIQKSYREKALVVIPLAMRSQKQQLMQQYFEQVDWQGLKMPSAEKRQRDSLKSIERSVEVWKDWIRLKKVLATLGEELPPVELLPAKRKKQSPDTTKKDASKEEFGRRALAGDSLSCLLTLLESFDKNNPEMGIDSVARQMHRKTVHHYWVNIVKQQVTGGGGPTLRDTLIQPMGAALNQPTFQTQAQALLGKEIASTQRNKTQRLRVSSKKTVKWRLNGCHLARA